MDLAAELKNRDIKPSLAFEDNLVLWAMEVRRGNLDVVINKYRTDMPGRELLLTATPDNSTVYSFIPKSEIDKFGYLV